MEKQEFSKKLKEQREQAGLSVQEVVDKLTAYGYSIKAKTIYGYESGHRTPDADVFIALCDIYGTKNTLEAYGYREISGKKENPLSDELISLINQMNAEGRNKALDYVKDLVDTGKYKKDLSEQRVI